MESPLPEGFDPSARTVLEGAEPSFAHVLAAAPSAEQRAIDSLLARRLRLLDDAQDEIYGALDSEPEPDRTHRVDRIFRRIVAIDDEDRGRPRSDHDEDVRLDRILREEGVR